MKKKKTHLSSIDREHLEEVVMDLWKNLFDLHQSAKMHKDLREENTEMNGGIDADCEAQFFKEIIDKFYYNSLAGLSKSFEKVLPAIWSFGKEYKDLNLSTKQMIGWYRNRSKEAIKISKKLRF